MPEMLDMTGIMTRTEATTVAWQGSIPTTNGARDLNALQDSFMTARDFFGPRQDMGGTADMLRSFADLLQIIADQMDGGGQGSPSLPPAFPQPFPPPDFGFPGPVTPQPDFGEPIAGSGRIWGDPHFIGADGGQYDVQGEAGKTYNLLSDKDFQMNGRFDQWGDKEGTTVVGAVGINAGGNQVEVHKDGEVIVNGQKLEAGDRVALEGGGYVSVSADGKDVEVQHGEWKVDFDFKRQGTDKAHLDLNVSTSNAIADGVKPHGLLGQTFDGDGEARNGDKGRGKQGGGAIEDADGNITERGDRNAVESYEVDGLHDQSFETHNQVFDDAGSMASEGGMTAEQQAVMDSIMQTAIVLGYTMMAQMMQSANGMMQKANSTEA